MTEAMSLLQISNKCFDMCVVQQDSDQLKDNLISMKLLSIGKNLLNIDL